MALVIEQRVRALDSAVETVPAPWSRLQILVLAICTMVNMLDGMDVLIVSYVAPAMATEWNVGFQALGIIFSAGLAGMMIGCVVVAPFADSFGRRPLILIALTMITLGTLGTGLSTALVEFGIYRLVTGIGIGTLLASIAALVSEYAPAGRRSFAIGVFQAGYPIGAVLTGLVAIWTIPHFGWQATLIGAACASAIVLPIAFFWLPESVSFIAARQPRHALSKINALRIRLGEPLMQALPPRQIGGRAPKVGLLFANGLWRSTLLLWVSTSAGFAVLYFVTSWIPKLSMEAGLSADRALWAGSIFNLGGFVGALSIGWIATRRDIGRLIRGYMIVGAALLILFGTPLPLTAVLIIACLIGLTLQGGFSGFYSLAAALYPAEIRSAGIGWAMGIGRGGSIIGPLAGGALLQLKLPMWMVFACFAVPLIVSGVLASFVRHRAEKT